MRAKRNTDGMLTLLCVTAAVVDCYYLGGWQKWILAVTGTVLALIFAVLFIRESGEKPQCSGSTLERKPGITELLLLNEENQSMTSWNLYGKTGLVIGRDIGENSVDINLNNSIYASMIDVEHAVLNYSGNDWYVEDLGAKNGVSVQKSDGRKYRLAPGKPCRLEAGDLIYIAMTRLLIR